ncbi:MAG: MotA/TolQ/ExbB proton channel family protein, partial [Spirochaetes bacterium]|nr:MotA/TolQ/ExbB proton channel family protein [Spirochaetota bacterium]
PVVIIGAGVILIYAQENGDLSGGDNLFSTVKKGGPLMIALILLGIGAMTIIIERIIYFTRMKVWTDNFIKEGFPKIISETKLKYKEDIEDELRSAFFIYSNNLERGFALLAGIGNIAPVVGFLGTVIGMISAFASIAAATTVNAKVVAVGIQVALITTAGGLMVAAPTLIAYYFFMHIIQSKNSRAEDVIMQLISKYPSISESISKGE